MNSGSAIHPDTDPRDLLQRRAIYSIGKLWKDLLHNEKFKVVGYAVRDLLVLNAIKTERKYDSADVKRAYYLSMEFLVGRLLRNNLVNLKMLAEGSAILNDLGDDLEKIIESENDAALGNGGLGRLAACFIDSLATHSLPGFGYGILYEYGLFKQVIRNGQQEELPDYWMLRGSPWIIERSDEYAIVQFGGHVSREKHHGEYRPRWVGYDIIVGVPFDLPIVGYGGQSVNYLRLFAARASDEFNMRIFNEGDYIRAVEHKVMSETVSKVLYPNDQPEGGQKLRLLQEYFLVTCSLQDVFRKFKGNNYGLLPEKAAIHLNDTHPSLAVPELMRLLVDIYRVPWENAWDITTRTISYTNHTLLPEALEKWNLEFMYELLPRHLEIIFEINQRFLNMVQKKYPGDMGKLSRLSIIDESGGKQVRMANLSIVGSHSVNGVAAVHSNLVKTRLVPDFYELWPEKFNNKTNGVTPRRWILSANPELSQLVSSAIGEGWITNLEEIRALEKYAGDSAFLDKLENVKRKNKIDLSNRLSNRNRIKVDPDTIFDVQIKRIHEYKRQLLNLLHIVYLYQSIVEDGKTPAFPRTFIFAGKAAPGYHRAKEIIYLIHKVAEVIRKDTRTSDLINVVFVPDYSVTVAENLIPASEISEQVSTAGFEASGTGNMKFAMNGALTIGTLDGANIEIMEEVGEENIFIFGNTVDEIEKLKNDGTHPSIFYNENERTKRVMDLFKSDLFSPGDHGRFHWVFDAFVNHWDPYFHLADLNSYLDTHARVDGLFADKQGRNRMSLLNIARMGKFSSDRTIKEYSSEIWKIEPSTSVNNDIQ